MTTLVFPSNPTAGQQYTSDFGITWTWDGSKWTVGQSVLVPAVTPPPVPPVTPPPVVTTVYDPLLNIAFPVNPTIGQLYTSPDGIAYEWKGNRWAVVLGNTILPPTTITNVTLPTATQTTLGGVIVGNGIANNNGIISVDTAAITAAVSSSVAVPATKSEPGQVIIGNNIDVATDGTISVPVATNSTLGVVKAGTNISIDGLGTLSVPTGAGINTLESISNVNPSGITDGSLLVYNRTANRWDVTVDLTKENWDSGQY
jgi:hypothetical protein